LCQNRDRKKAWWKKSRTVAIERIKPRKGLPATVASEWAVVRMQLLVTLAVMLPRKTFTASRPFALEGFLIVVRT
jgi:hypothetical protein